MRAWEPAVRDITRAEIARWPVGKPFALRPSMQSITLDVIVRVVFGVETSARRDELRRHILAVTGLGRNPLVLFATRDRRLGPHSPWARFIRARDALHAALVSEIRRRREAPDLGQRGDVLSQLLLARDDEGRAMTDDEVRDELVTLLFAGHETTAASLAWAFDLLLHHPRALSRLVAELDGGASEYLDATIMETLRVRPVVALVDRHVRQAVGIGGHTIPAGAIACPNIYLVQRRADLYQDPAAFRPDRFVGQTPPAFGWFPFGGGIRRCLGASFATFEMRIVLPEVLRAVTLRPASRRPARVRREAVTFVPHDGARCVVTARSQPTARPLKADGFAALFAPDAVIESQRAGRSSARASPRRQGSTPGRWPRPIPCTSGAGGCRSVPGARRRAAGEEGDPAGRAGRPRSPLLPPSLVLPQAALPAPPCFPAQATTLSTAADSRQPRRASGPAHGDHREIRLRPGTPAGHRDRVLIRRETARDAHVIRAITTAAFAAGRPPGPTL